MLDPPFFCMLTHAFPVTRIVVSYGKLRTYAAAVLPIWLEYCGGICFANY